MHVACTVGGQAAEWGTGSAATSGSSAAASAARSACSCQCMCLSISAAACHADSSARARRDIQLSSRPCMQRRRPAQTKRSWRSAWRGSSGCAAALQEPAEAGAGVHGLRRVHPGLGQCLQRALKCTAALVLSLRALAARQLGRAQLPDPWCRVRRLLWAAPARLRG